jgi:cystinosin
LESSTLSWSASFYPQPVLNWRRKSTHGLAIDFPTINVLGFVCYTISTSAFLYSPLIRQQYAARHISSPEPTVRFNDLAFALHAVVLTLLTCTQFFPDLWGFKVGKHQRVSQPIAGIVFGSLLAVILVILVVMLKSSDGGYNAAEWAWIDVVGVCKPDVRLALTISDLCYRIHQAFGYVGQVHAASLGQLQA